jgi:hypothetical protein
MISLPALIMMVGKCAVSDVQQLNGLSDCHGRVTGEYNTRCRPPGAGPGIASRAAFMVPSRRVRDEEPRPSSQPRDTIDPYTSSDAARPVKHAFGKRTQPAEQADR